MISCWVSRHCFSLSSVSVSRCSRMETVCKTNGGQASGVGGATRWPWGSPQPVPLSCSACCPVWSLSWWLLGTTAAFVSPPGSARLFSDVHGQGEDAVREGRHRVPQPSVLPQDNQGSGSPAPVVWHLDGSPECYLLLTGLGFCPQSARDHHPSPFQR